MVIPGQLLGLWVSGDFGEMTAYTRKDGRVIIFPKSPPTRPPSVSQIKQRKRFLKAQKSYMSLPASTRADWETLTQKNSIDMTGQNAYISLSLNPDNAKLKTLNKRASLSLLPPTPVPR